MLPQPSLMRQECLELDQRTVALLSRVRHTEVQLKQQQQQPVGRSLIALEDVIRQTEVRDPRPPACSRPHDVSAAQCEREANS